MKTMLVRTATVTAALPLVAASGVGIALAEPDRGAPQPAPADLAAVRAATAEYHDVDRALADGFVADPHCAESPQGVMGHHYVHYGRVADPTIDPLAPEVLLYVPGADGRLQLAGVEYVKLDDDQDWETVEEPSVFGLPLDGPMVHGGPLHYDLHVWIWRHNPDGTTAQWNPALDC